VKVSLVTGAHSPGPVVIAVVATSVVEVASLVLASLVVEVELDVVGAALVVELAVVVVVVAEVVEVDEFAVVSPVGLPPAQAEAIRRSPHARGGRYLAAGVMSLIVRERGAAMTV
jgi:hypothetical protein